MIKFLAGVLTGLILAAGVVAGAVFIAHDQPAKPRFVESMPIEPNKVQTSVVPKPTQ